MDIHSYAEPNRVRVAHVSLKLKIDFTKKELGGTAELTLDRRDPLAPVVLDTQALVVEQITTPGGENLKFTIGKEDANLGAPLTVNLPPVGDRIIIHYHTTENAGALQWLTPEQTAGGRHPFLFTQGQSIFTRSWVPLQDSPAVRITYDAEIEAPPGLTPVMSAERLGVSPRGAYKFKLTLPIPPYLMALACGELKFLPISERCGIWAELPVVEGARSEFEDTEKMVQAVERLFGEYRWGRYDILVLPPSFPFGGMENPMLTFATPTVLAGDKSLVALVAHELAHSWSGNLVTNATWSDFWLNEGFTMYLEGRIMEEVYGHDRALLEMQLGRADLLREMKEMDVKDQILYIDLKGRHPDDGFSLVPYEKGVMFLRRVEEVAGRPAFDKFLNSYFDEHAFRSITTNDFLNFMNDRLPGAKTEVAKKVNIQEWIHGAGLPADAPDPRSQSLAEVERVILQFRAGAAPATFHTNGWVTQQWQHFLTNLPEPMDAARMAALDAVFKFTNSRNSEILGEWLRLSIQYQYRAADAKIEDFLMNVGRRKFLKPLYTEFAKTPDGKARAREIYKKARPRYHPMAQATVDKILG